MRQPPTHIAILALGLMLTLAGALAAHRAWEDAAALRLARHADVAERDVATALATTVARLRGADAMIRSRGLPTASAFSRYVGAIRLESGSGVQGLGFALDLGDRPHAAAQARLRRAGFDLVLWPRSAERARSAIVLLEPGDARNRAALGFDMLSEPRRRAAMLAAAADGEAHVTAPVRLVQEIDAGRVQPGFLVYLPTHRADGGLLGWTYSPLRAGDFFGAALRATPPDVAVAVRWGDDVLYSAGDWTGVRRRVERRLQIDGVIWRLSVGEVGHAFALSPALLVALIGALTSLGLAGFLRFREQIVLQLKAALAEAERASALNETLLQEVNHRVANSLSLAGGLLLMQKRASGNEEVRAALRTAANRVTAIGRVHQDLYRSRGGPITVGASTFLETLATDLRANLLGEESGVTLTVEAADVTLPAQRAVLIGIVATELATNAVKYAFPEGRGTIALRLAAEDDRLAFSVADDGVGFAAGVQGDGLGSRIVAALADQLGADLDRRSGPGGSTVTLKFAP